MTKQLGSTDLKRLHRHWRRQTDGSFALLLDGIASPFNLGAILRTAAAYRVDHLYIAASQIDPTTKNVGRTALGTDRYVAWTATETAEEAIASVRATDHRLVGLELTDTATALHETPLHDRVCLAVGHEDRGLSKATLAACDATVFLPQLGKVGSLNVATATSIAIWEIRRQQWEANPQ